jgi:hypothetical protein
VTGRKERENDETSDAPHFVLVCVFCRRVSRLRAKQISEAYFVTRDVTTYKLSEEGLRGAEERAKSRRGTSKIEELS